MKVSNLGEDLNTYLKDHKEIQKALQKIKEYENRFKKYDLSELDFNEDFIEIDNQLEEFIETSPKKEEKPKIRKKISYKRSKTKQITIRQLDPTVFHFKINQEGELENLDIKKPPIRQNRKDKERLKEKTDKKTKLSRLKIGFSKIKKAIPSSQKNTEESEVSEE